MRAASIALAIVSGLAVTSRGARGQDSRDLADTIMSTWNGGVIRLQEGDKRFVVVVNTPVPSTGIRVRGEIGLPLDDDTRIAAFVRPDRAPAYKATLFFGYDSTYRDLALDSGDAMAAADLTECKRHGLDACTRTALLCKRHGIDPCDASSIRKTLRQLGRPLMLDVKTYWSFGAEASFARDELDVYRDSAGTEMASVTKRDLQLSAILSIYHGSLGYVVRGGATSVDDLLVVPFRRCMSLPSESADVRNEVCGTRNLLVRHAEGDLSGFIRSSVTWQPQLPGTFWTSYFSALEARVNLEQFGGEEPRVDVVGLVLLKGFDFQSGRTRIGFGAMLGVPLESDQSVVRGADLSIFGVIGTAF